MIFALETDTGELEVFESPEQALMNCEKYDIASGVWAFFAANGMPLAPLPEPQRVIFGMKIDVPEYVLDPSNIGEGANLLERLNEVRTINRGPFPTIEAVRTYLQGVRASG